MNPKELGAQPAAPSSDRDLDPRCIGWVGGGLTKRELFAAMAMQGLLAAPMSDWANADSEIMAKYKEQNATMGQFFADQAVNYADALLAELAKDQP